jgi:hypothetical protein
MLRILRVLQKGYGLCFAAGVLIVLPVVAVNGPTGLWLLGCALLVAGMLLRWSRVLAQRPRKDRAGGPVRLPAPVGGRWMALNGPARKVPGHGTHAYAQSYAIDVLFAREGVEDVHRQRMATAAWFWPAFRRPAEYPTFGRPVLAPADGTVVAVCDDQRDHRGRLSVAGLVLLVVVEGLVRDLGPVRWLLGNHVIVRIDDPGAGAGAAPGGEVYAVFAHLRRGSPRVAPGDRVTACTQLAECGNSGNSSDPHLHYQLMDGPDPRTARGLPFAWEFTDDEGERRTGVPENLSHFTTPAPPAR